MVTAISKNSRYERDMKTRTNVFKPFLDGAPWNSARFSHLDVSEVPSILDTRLVTVLSTSVQKQMSDSAFGRLSEPVSPLIPSKVG